MFNHRNFIIPEVGQYSLENFKELQEISNHNQSVLLNQLSDITFPFSFGLHGTSYNNFLKISNDLKNNGDNLFQFQIAQYCAPDFQDQVDNILKLKIIQKLLEYSSAYTRDKEDNYFNGERGSIFIIVFSMDDLANGVIALNGEKKVNECLPIIKSMEQLIAEDNNLPLRRSIVMGKYKILEKRVKGVIDLENHENKLLLNQWLTYSSNFEFKNLKKYIYFQKLTFDLLQLL